MAWMRQIYTLVILISSPLCSVLIHVGVCNGTVLNRNTVHYEDHQSRVSPRAALGKGARTIELLLENVIPVPTKSPYYKKYIKFGTQKDAIDDFWSTKPGLYKVTKSKAGESVTDAYIGNTMLRLNMKDRLQHDRPTITLRTKNKKLNAKIVYMYKQKTDQ